jgi:hypothetical protein
MNKIIQWNTSSENTGLGPHSDFEKNLQIAYKFISKTKASWNPGINLCVRDTVFWIEFSPGRESKMHVHASPISLHQSCYEFERAMVFQFNKLNHMAKKPNDQMEF